MKVLFLLLFSLLAMPAQAICVQENLLGTIAFDSDSSYFNHQGKATLDKLLDDIKHQHQGYLLLKFSFDKAKGNQKLSNYNMWLAQRRIGRVKNYLLKNAELEAATSANLIDKPIVSRILTAGTENRQVSIYHCQHQQEFQLSSTVAE